MRKRHLVWYAAAVAIVVLWTGGMTLRAADATASEIQRRLVGNWKLVSFDSFDAAGKASPGSLNEGWIMYDEHGNMACQLMWRGEPHRHTAYYGKYQIDPEKGTVTHLVEGAWREDWLGTSQVRYFAFSNAGNRLMLSVKTDDRVTGTLTWERQR
jgi:hypothetical protein